jgi:RNA polymerase-associated protein CTR9
MHQGNEAHDLLKDSLASQNSNLNLRAYYTYFLIQFNASKGAREFVFGTLRDHDKHDLYALCAAGWLHYYQARESRDMSPKGVEERRLLFRRSAEFYEKALGLDPLCAVAAQGLAIVTAEDALGTLGGALPPGPAPDEPQRRAMNARDALEVFAKVRESTNDGSVHVNMGHCFFARDELDRAIESVRTLIAASCPIWFFNSLRSMRQRRNATMVGGMFPYCSVSHGRGTSRQTRNNHSRR